MDQQIDYAAGMPLSIFDDTPVVDPATPSPGMLIAGEDQVGEASAMSE